LEDDQIPYVPFADITVNLSLPENFSLQYVGSYKLHDEGGVKGLIIYHKSPEVYYAFERNCSYSPNDACATVEVEPSGLRMVDNCCGSVFDFEGRPISGPAWRPLRRYVVSKNGSFLTISDEIEE
jgi:hypothetical protein